MARKAGSTGETTRARIRAAATRLFAERGYDALTMRALGAEVGLQAGALYRYFPDKETLAGELLDEAVAARDAALDGAADFGAFVTACLDWRIAQAAEARLIAQLGAALGRDTEADPEERLAALLDAEAEARLPDTRAGAGAVLAVVERIAGDERLARERRLRIGLKFAERIAGL